MAKAVGWIKTKLGTKVGLDPGHIVLDGDQAVEFSADVCCGQMAGWMPLGMEAGLGPSHIVLDEDQALPQRGTPQF